MGDKKEKLLDVFYRYSRYPDFLGERIVDVNQKGMIDDAILHIAARKDQIGDIKILLEAGADVNIRGDLAYTPLHYACMCGNLSAVKLLLKFHADPLMVNEFNQTAFDVALLANKPNSKEIIALLKTGRWRSEKKCK